jgi:hypothetical protein
MIRCPECEHLTNLYADLVKENADVLNEYHAALQARDTQKVNLIREALPGIEQFRKEANEIMLAHRATHHATPQADSASIAGR